MNRMFCVTCQCMCVCLCERASEITHAFLQVFGKRKECMLGLCKYRCAGWHIFAVCVCVGGYPGGSSRFSRSAPPCVE